MRALVFWFVLLVGSSALGQQSKEITNSIGMKLVLIPAGMFTMGSPIGEEGRSNRMYLYLSRNLVHRPLRLANSVRKRFVAGTCENLIFSQD